MKNQTDVIFSFDAEDFTSNTAADAIYREAEILREEGVRGGFCIVGLLAKQLKTWGRTDVQTALKHHDILTHSYGHSLHPTLHEYTDIADFDEAYAEVYRQETEGLLLIKDFTENAPILGGCPPGNQKNYVAMYAYADMGLPLYADTLCDTPDGRGMYYCNIYQTQYTFSLENFFRADDDAYMREVLDTLAAHKRVICFTHPNAAIFSEFWDSVNYFKENSCAFGEWKPCQKRPEAETENYYKNIRRFIQLMKKDGRFNITDYKTLSEKLRTEPARTIRPSHVPAILDALSKDFAPLQNPSLCLSDLFLAAKAFLLGETQHVCGKVYGFLDTPYAIQAPCTISKADLIASAQSINTEKFLPSKIMVGNTALGPADWLFAALEALCGNERIILQPRPQLPDLAQIAPRLHTINFKGGWIQSDSMEDHYLSNRLRLQCWTMRFADN